MTQINNLARHLATLRMFLGRIALLIFAMHVAGCGDKDKEKTQTPPVTSAPQPAQPEPVPKPEAQPLTSLESLAAPIALYPDPLLAEVLVAATYPLEVVQAARWLESKPDPATVRGKNWDASVVRLTAVPEVIAMMDQHLDWTTQLGDAFMSNPPQLMDAIQTLRKRAIDAGFLKDSDLQKVEAETVSASEPEQDQLQAGGVEVTPAVYTKEVVSIKPAKADTLAVPKYNPEVVYAASMAPPPTTQMYPAGTMTAAPAASYYPTYYAQPATTTTTTSSSSDQWMSFGTGAVVGGLLTWGIMEWADDDDWDDYHVSHHYGDAVCHGGNCWHGGGGGNYSGSRYGNANVSRGDVNVDRDVNISGNEINVSRDGTFSANQLTALKGQTSRWQPNPSHRRGQDYPIAAQQRMGRTESPALAGSRLSGAQNLPADTRGFGTDRSAQARPSSADVQQRLAAKPSAVESSRQPVSGSRENALEGLQASGQRNNVESRRGASSQSSRQQQAGRARTKNLGASTNAAAQSQRRAEPARQRSGNQQQMARQRNEQTQQRLQSQRRQEMSRPSAFESTRDGGRSSASFSDRGSASYARAQQPVRQSPSPGGQREVSRGGGAPRSRGGRR
jgi:hypothetical protein